MCPTCLVLLIPMYLVFFSCKGLFGSMYFNILCLKLSSFWAITNLVPFSLLLIVPWSDFSTLLWEFPSHSTVLLFSAARCNSTPSRFLQCDYASLLPKLAHLLKASPSRAFSCMNEVGSGWIAEHSLSSSGCIEYFKVAVWVGPTNHRDAKNRKWTNVCVSDPLPFPCLNGNSNPLLF